MCPIFSLKNHSTTVKSAAVLMNILFKKSNLCDKFTGVNMDKTRTLGTDTRHGH